jgi:Tfp pilus assembly protein PilF
MTAIIILVIFSLLAHYSIKHHDQELLEIPRVMSDRVSKLWEIAHGGMRDNRLLRAEKALLSILKIDQKNASAYNRLGILYAKQKELNDAIDCFEIASSLEPSASTLHNLGLIYYETAKYDKASIAFEQAIKLEDQVANRYIVYAKAQEKLGNDSTVIASLQKAVDIETTKEHVKLLIQAMADRNMDEAAKETANKYKELVKKK